MYVVREHKNVWVLLCNFWGPEIRNTNCVRQRGDCDANWWKKIATKNNNNILFVYLF